MLDINWVCDNLDAARTRLATKGSTEQLDAITELNQRRKALQHRSDDLKREKKTLSQTFQETAKAGGDVAALKARSQALKDEEKTVDQEFAQVKAELHDLALTLPNLPDPEAPIGGEAQNAVVKVHGEPEPLPFPGRDHLDIAEALGLLDMGRGAKIAGSGFALFTGLGARLARALINLMLDLHSREHGYTEVSPPFLVTRTSITGTGQLPKLEEDMYHCGRDDLFLIPTAEVPVTNIHADEIIPADQLPIAYCAYSPCFRREAGSYGADTRGLTRLHQFDKVELVRFCHPDRSDDEHKLLLGHAEAVLQKLGLRYRILDLATGDMSFAAARCFDIEAWAPASQRYFEVSSVSNFRDFQARRAAIRTRDDKTRPLHTLNGSGLALPRVILCILEQYQNEDGTVRVPEALQPYLGVDTLGAAS